MSSTTALTNKLVSAPLISLTLVLAIGAFLWQSSLYQKLLDRVDAELFLAARTLDHLHRTQETDQAAAGDFCAAATALLNHSAPAFATALYAQNGRLVCQTGPQPSAHQQVTSYSEIATETSYFFTSVDGTRLRSVLLPLSRADQSAAFMVLSADFSQHGAELFRWRLMLLLTAMLILAAAALYLRHPRPYQHGESLNKLKRLMEQVGPDQPSPVFSVDNTQPGELHQLAKSCSQMVERMHTGIHKARQFAAHVAHELRTPLTILRGETEIALRNNRNTEDVRQVLESNLEEITRMSYLVDDLLTLSKSDLGEIPLQPESIRLHKLLLDLQRQARVLARDKDVTIEMECSDKDYVIHADELRLRQALLNLLSNAVRYTPFGGVVRISASTYPTGVTLTVSDNGIGIDEKHLQHIFERFYRVDKKVHQYDGGTGLGLAIVKWVVDAHRGTIEVSSTPGQGSRFAITLPQNQDNHPPQSP